jgi:C4-dicarboxylate transporter
MRTSRGLNDQHYKGEKSCGNDLGSAELMSFAEQIASAMAHLERYNVSLDCLIHAADNIGRSMNAYVVIRFI